ncbi:hypothetical protein BOSEA31B_11480 [Hyphomicrobiales bacterium]|nr:hypothetical protein BOSEA31B_11480 [Hyphomicrobiales bacterium]CAH1697276.1 hypothetical protein BOSEA1005_10313 [Hyphomicrobiales bacterium]CAI0342843.1 hypothetical protein BO1005MUT1_10136 [Hyphomicrobiales bacterium]
MSNAYDADAAETDAGNLAELLDIVVSEETELSRAGMTPEQIAALARIGALAWVGRDIARRLAENVFAAVKAA